MTAAVPALLVALVAAPGAPAEVRPAPAPANVGSAASAAQGGAQVRCEGRAAPRLHEEAANVSVTRLRTERAAHDDAVRACLAALRALPLGDGTVGDRLGRDPALARDVEKAVRAARPDAPRLFSDGGVALRLAVPLDGALSRLLVGRASWAAPLDDAPAAPGSR